MVTKKEIKDAIKARIDRFNRLFKEALGYTFEEEVEVEEKRYEREMAEYQPKVEARAKELGFESENDYVDYLWDNKIDIDDERRDPVMQELWKSKPKPASTLYLYEMSVINEAERIANWFIDHFGENAKEQWDEFAHDSNDSYGFIKAVQDAGYDGWYDGHSGNSGSAAVSFAYTLMFQTELFPYMHGSLATLVGDAGYHDDRSDVHEVIEKYKKEHGEE